MSVFLGNDGLVQLLRTADATGFIAKVTTDDVNTTRNRFSYDYVGELGGGLSAIRDTDGDEENDNFTEMMYVPLITGDRVNFQRVTQNSTTGAWDNSTEDQELVEKSDGSFDTDFTAYVNVDGLGGIRLYESFEDAINLNKAAAYTLNAISETHHFRVKSGQLDRYRGLARITSYDFTTNREQIDTTTLGKNYRRYFSNGLIAGQGTLECLFPLKDPCQGDDEDQCETARYLAELVLRLEEGAVFGGKFILNSNDIANESRPRSLYYECEKCVITSTAVTVSPADLVRVTIQFITTGPFQLRYGSLPAFLLVEGIKRIDDGNELLLQENDDGLEILDDDVYD
jgi:hypothetical protein